MFGELKNGHWPPALSRNYPALSAREQLRLLESKVVIAGLGGLGGYLSTFMARMGVGHIVLVDGDSYDLSNLNRQVLATHDTLGKNKARVSSEHCQSINPEMKTTVWETHFTTENGEDILRGTDLVLDGLDHIPTRKLLFSMAMDLNIPFIHGAVAEWSGQTSTFLPQQPFTIDQIYKSDTFSDTPPSVLAPAVAAIASIEALEATRLLIGCPPANVGKLVLFDGEDFSFHKIPLHAQNSR